MYNINYKLKLYKLCIVQISIQRHACRVCSYSRSCNWHTYNYALQINELAAELYYIDYKSTQELLYAWL